MHVCACEERESVCVFERERESEATNISIKYVEQHIVKTRCGQKGERTVLLT